MFVRPREVCYPSVKADQNAVYSRECIGRRDAAWRRELGQVASECGLGTENTRPGEVM